jgi:hypothetical protein
VNDMHMEERELTAWLRELATDEAASGASDAVQMRLMDEVRRLRHARRRSLMKMSVAAAALSIATAMPIWRLAKWNSRPALSVAQSRPVPVDGEMATAFFPLMYSTVPMSGGRLVRLEVPRATLRAYGLDGSEPAGSASKNVLADVLVGDDGLARAVRFVRPMTREVQRERQR